VKPSFGPCSINPLNLSQAWSIPSSSPCMKLITCLLRCWTLLIGKTSRKTSLSTCPNCLQLQRTQTNTMSLHCRDSIWTIHRELLLDAPCCISSWNPLCVYMGSP
jgi:hypothetical protein